MWATDTPYIGQPPPDAGSSSTPSGAGIDRTLRIGYNPPVQRQSNWDVTDAKTNVSAEDPPPSARARFPGAYGHPRRPGGPQGSTPEGPLPPQRGKQPARQEGQLEGLSRRGRQCRIAGIDYPRAKDRRPTLSLRHEPKVSACAVDRLQAGAASGEVLCPPARCFGRQPECSGRKPFRRSRRPLGGQRRAAKSRQAPPARSHAASGLEDPSRMGCGLDRSAGVGRGRLAGRAAGTRRASGTRPVATGQ